MSTAQAAQRQEHLIAGAWRPSDNGSTRSNVAPLSDGRHAPAIRCCCRWAAWAVLILDSSVIDPGPL